MAALNWRDRLAAEGRPQLPHHLGNASEVSPPRIRANKTGLLR